MASVSSLMLAITQAIASPSSSKDVLDLLLASLCDSLTGLDELGSRQTRTPGSSSSAAAPTNNRVAFLASRPPIQRVDSQTHSTLSRSMNPKLYVQHDASTETYGLMLRDIHEFSRSFQVVATKLTQAKPSLDADLSQFIDRCTAVVSAFGLLSTTQPSSQELTKFAALVNDVCDASKVLAPLSSIVLIERAAESILSVCRVFSASLDHQTDARPSKRSMRSIRREFEARKKVADLEQQLDLARKEMLSSRTKKKSNPKHHHHSHHRSSAE